MAWIFDKFRGLRRRLSDGRWERHFGVNTMGLKPGPVEDGHWYVTTPYRSIFRVLRAASLTPGDVLFDLGCGKGRVLLAATRTSARKLVGVELNPELAQLARDNLQRQSLPPGRAEIRNQNVLDVDYDEATALFLFDPFGARTLEGVLRRLKDSLDRHPRPLRLAFILAIAPESLEVLAQCGWLQCTQRFDIRDIGTGTFKVSIWQSTLPAAGRSAAVAV